MIAPPFVDHILLLDARCSSFPPLPPANGASLLFLSTFQNGEARHVPNEFIPSRHPPIALLSAPLGGCDPAEDLTAHVRLVGGEGDTIDDGLRFQPMDDVQRELRRDIKRELRRSVILPSQELDEVTRTMIEVERQRITR